MFQGSALNYATLYKTILLQLQMDCCILGALFLREPKIYFLDFGLCTGSRDYDHEVLSCIGKTYVSRRTTCGEVQKTSAFYGGEARDEFRIQQNFKSIVKHMGRVLHDQWWFAMVQDFFLKYIDAPVAVALIMEPFFPGHLKPDLQQKDVQRC